MEMGHQTLPKAFKLGASSRVNLTEKTVAPKGRTSETMTVGTSRVMSSKIPSPTSPTSTANHHQPSWPNVSRHSSFNGNRFAAAPSRTYQHQSSVGASSSGSNSSGGTNSSLSSSSLYSAIPSAVKSIPSRFMNQDIMKDAASFLSQRLPGLSGVSGASGSSSGGPASQSSTMHHFQKPVPPGYLKTPFGRQDR
jgi:hypothetical protein